MVKRIVLPEAVVEPARVFLLYHVSHERLGCVAAHRDADGALVVDPEAGDDVKLLGCYSTLSRTNDRILAARTLPGFQKEPDCFFVSEYTVDHDEWREGFESLGDNGRT